MANVTGTLKRVHTKNHRGKDLYSMLVDVNGEDTWFGCGEKLVTAPEGSVISFNYKNNGRFKNLDGDVSVDTAAPAPAPGGSKSYQGGGAREDYWADKAVKDVERDLQYNYRAAHMFAKDVVLALVASGNIELPATKGKALEATLGYIDTVSEEYYQKFLMEDPSIPDEGEAEVEMD